MDQKDLVDQRDEDIREIANMAEKVFAISNDIKNLTQRQGEALDNIIKKQEDIEDNAGKAVDELEEANEFSRKKLKKVLIWGGVLLALAICVTALVYIIKDTKKSKDDKKKLESSGLTWDGLSQIAEMDNFSRDYSKSFKVHDMVRNIC